MTKQGSATKKLLKILGIIVVVVALGAITAKSMGWLDGGVPEKTVETSKAELRTITQVVSSSGRIQPEVEVIIRPDVSGEIIELNVKEGDFVRQGELLLRIRPDIYQARIDELNAGLLMQMSRLEQARSGKLQAEVEYSKQSQLFERNLISDLQYQQSKNNYQAQVANFKAAEYQIESAKAQLRRAQEELEQTVIRAPKNGTISRLSVERGERVLGNAQTAGTEMMRIARLEQMEVIVDVNENDIVNVSVGDTTRIEVDAYPNRGFDGIVTEIANSADITGSGMAEQVTNYKVKIRITTPHNLQHTGREIIQEAAEEGIVAELTPNFRPGMSAIVDIETNTAWNVVSVPIQGVTVRDFSRDRNSAESDTLQQARTTTDRRANREDFRRVVFVVNDGVVIRREVKTGISDNSHIQILHGLSDGEEIVTGSYRILSRELADGDAVRVNNSRPQFASR
jgi:HlyD family secretion protein